MSLQDDIFDVAEIIEEGSYEEKAFHNILSVFNQLEEDCERLSEENSVLRKVICIVNGEDK